MGKTQSFAVTKILLPKIISFRIHGVGDMEMKNSGEVLGNTTSLGGKSEARFLHDEEGMIDVVIACIKMGAKMIDLFLNPHVRLNRGNMIRRAIEAV